MVVIVASVLGIVVLATLLTKSTLAVLVFVFRDDDVEVHDGHDNSNQTNQEDDENNLICLV